MQTESEKVSRIMKALKKVWNIITTTLVVLIILLAVALVGVRIFGYRPLSVLSGSMEPTYHVGSLIYVKEVDYTTLQVGDPITFMIDEDTIVTHRIAGIVPDEDEPGTLRFRTKGDANAQEDAMLVHYKNIIGVPKFTIPYLGYVATYIQTPPGCYFAIAIAAVAVLASFLPDLFDDSDKKEKKEEKAE